jgi:Sulfotransferase family
MTTSPDGLAGQPASAPGRMPDFFIVGHPKSGTTALYEMLRRHPRIFMPSVKEPRWFSPDLRDRQRAVAAIGPQPEVPETVEEYLELFAAASPDQLLGEASSSYLRSAAAAELIARANPEARIIAILREPASFLRSLQLELIQNHVEVEQDLRRALELEDRAGDGQVLRYTDRVRYVEQLRRFHAVFPPEQVLVLIYDDFRADNQANVLGVMRFLGVEEIVPAAPVEANPTVRVRSVGLDRALGRLQAAQGPWARPAKRALKALGMRDALGKLKRRLLYAGPRPAEERLLAELRVRFEPEVAALGEYLGRDLLSLWGYAGSGR